jgi:hypothetical protein
MILSYLSKREKSQARKNKRQVKAQGQESIKSLQKSMRKVQLYSVGSGFQSWKLGSILIQNIWDSLGLDLILHTSGGP